MSLNRWRSGLLARRLVDCRLERFVIAGIGTDASCCDVEAAVPGVVCRRRKIVEPCVELVTAPDADYQLVGSVLGGGSVVGIDTIGAHRDERMLLPVDDELADAARRRGFNPLRLHGSVAVRSNRNGDGRRMTAARRCRGCAIRSIDESERYVCGCEQSQAGEGRGVAVELQLRFLSTDETCECCLDGNIDYILTLIIDYVNRGERRLTATTVRLRDTDYLYVEGMATKLGSRLG